jgi:GGDEF domain-containing protein
MRPKLHYPAPTIPAAWRSDSLHGSGRRCRVPPRYGGLIRHRQPARAAIVGHSQEMQGQPLVAFASNSTSRRCASAIVDAMRGAEPVLVEARLRCGELEPGSSCASAYANPAGVRELLVVGRDMSAARHRRTPAPHGDPRRADRTAEPPAAVRPHPHGDRQRAPLRPGLFGRHHRPGRLQEGQRRPRPPGRRRRAAQAAARLRKTLRDSDTLARVGGDEFVAVLPGTFNDAQIKLVTGRLLAALQSPFEDRQATRSTWAPRSACRSIPSMPRTRVRLVALADAAMSRAKETGKAPQPGLQPARKRPAAARHLARGGDVPGRARRRIPALLPADRQTRARARSKASRP